MDNFRLKIDIYRMNAYLTITKAEAMVERITPEMILEFLKESEIEFGINEDAIHELVERELWDKPIKVASGNPPVRGEDGYQEYYFRTKIEMAPKVLEDGSVDYKSLNLAQNVTEGQVLAKCIPPTDGTPGTNIYGETIPAEKGFPGHLIAGENTVFKDEDRMVLISEVDGNVKLRGRNRVIVDTVFHTWGDVDFSTGDLDVNGDIHVNGDILAGFKVKATGNVVVNGAVEDAVVEAGGDVLVRQGFVGTGKGTINAGGRAVFKFINNQTVHAAEIFIGEEAFHANLSAEKSINMTKGRGTLIGGVARAGEFVEINTIGSNQNIHTNIIVAEDADVSGDFEQIDDEIPILDSKLEEGMQRIMAIMDRVKGSNLSDSQKRLLRSLEEQSEVMDAKRTKLTEQRSTQEKEARTKSKDSYIKVMRKIYPEVRVQIAWMKEKNKKIRGAVEYRMGDDRLSVT